MHSLAIGETAQSVIAASWRKTLKQVITCSKRTYPAALRKKWLRYYLRYSLRGTFTSWYKGVSTVEVSVGLSSFCDVAATKPVERWALAIFMKQVTNTKKINRLEQVIPATILFKWSARQKEKKSRWNDLNSEKGFKVREPRNGQFYTLRESRASLKWFRASSS